MKKIDIQSLIANSKLFNGLSKEAIERLASGTTDFNVSKGTVLFKKGEPCNCLYLLLYGKVKLTFINSENVENVSDVFEAGDSFYESTLFLNERYKFQCQTLTECFILKISKCVLQHEMITNPLLSQRVIMKLSEQLHNKDSDFESHLFHTGSQRVIRYFLNEHKKTYKTDQLNDEAKETTIRLPISKGYIASKLNLSQEHFSRILSDLEEESLIQVLGKNITLLDLDKLHNYVKIV